MKRIATAIAIAQMLARNIVPLVGILVFHWSAGNVLLLYLLDTLLSMAVLLGGGASALTPPPKGQDAASWINAAVSIARGLVAAVLMCIPLGIPVSILPEAGFSFRDALHDSSLWKGAIIQTVLALWSYVGLYRALRTHSLNELRLGRRFMLVLMRWILVVMASYAVLAILPPGKVVLLLLVVAYIVGSIAAETWPDLFLRAMPGGEENLKEALKSTQPSADTPAKSPSADLEAVRERATQRHQR